MQRIIAISEAFSQTPAYIRVDGASYLNPKGYEKHFIKEIKLETKSIINQDGMHVDIQVYRCYNHLDQLIHEYLVNSVNVTYQND